MIRSRRSFLGASLAAASAPLILPSRVLGALSPSNTINVGVIGLGDRGSQHLQTLLPMPGVRVVGVCDVQRKKAEHWKAQVDRDQGDQACLAVQDARELIARPDIDALFITSPENWHAHHDIWAMRSGKDVYGEKGLALTVREGREIVNTARGLGRVFQTGTQQRSQGQFRRAVEMARNGYLGRLKNVEVSVPSGLGHFQKLSIVKPTPVPADIDYDLWLGPAPFTPFDEKKCTYYWYFMSDTCAGWIQSWGIHHIDIAHWGCPEFGRGRVTVEGEAAFPTDGLADVSYAWRIKYTSDSGLTIDYKNDEAPGFAHGVRFVGDEGWVHVTRGGIDANPKSLLNLALKPDDQRVHLSNNHITDFFDSMRTRRDPASPVEEGHKANTLTLIADIATRLRRKLTFDWATERFVDDPAADRMLSRAHRAPYVL